MKNDDETSIEAAVNEETAQEASNAEAEAEHNSEDSLEESAEELRKKCCDLLDRLQRTLAEFDNFRKRTAKEKAAMYSDGVRDTIEKLLPTVDNFERAMAAAKDKTDGFYTGIEMIYRQLMATLAELGVEELTSLGEPFDLNIHHAVAHVDDPAYGENIVIEELQKGYKYKDRVIRHSMVRVAN